MNDPTTLSQGYPPTCHRPRCTAPGRAVRRGDRPAVPLRTTMVERLTTDGETRLVDRPTIAIGDHLAVADQGALQVETVTVDGATTRIHSVHNAIPTIVLLKKQTR